MDRLISLRAAIDAFRQELVFDYEEQCTTFAGIKKILETLPPAQPEIIRCKDCIHWKDFACMKTCAVFDWQSTENDFCSFAERREE